MTDVSRAFGVNGNMFIRNGFFPFRLFVACLQAGLCALASTTQAGDDHFKNDVRVRVRLSVKNGGSGHRESCERVRAILTGKLAANPFVEVADEGAHIRLFVTVLTRTAQDGSIEQVVAIATGIHPITTKPTHSKMKRNSEHSASEFEQQLREAVLLQQLILIASTEEELPAKTAMAVKDMDRQVFRPYWAALTGGSQQRRVLRNPSSASQMPEGKTSEFRNDPS